MFFRSPAVHLLYHLMDPKFMSGHRVVFVGRPRTMRTVRSIFTLNFQQDIKKVEVCGFSDASVERYVLNQFSNNNNKTDENTIDGKNIMVLFLSN